MTASSPLLAAGALSSFKITSDGNAIDSTFEVFSIDVWSAVGKVPKAQLVLFDGSAADRDFDISNLSTFVPGKKIEIAVGYDGSNRTVFKGVIVKQGIEINETEASKLVVDITDETIKMTLARKNALFEKITDSDLIGKLITANGLAKDVASTSAVHEDIVQYYTSDWDLMLMRAEMNGFVATVDAGKVTVKAPDTSQSPVLQVEYGESILDLRAEMDAATQLTSSSISSFTWDAATQTVIKAGPGSVSVTEPGNISSAELAKVFGVDSFVQQSGAAIEKDALKGWSSAELLKSKLSKIRGHVRFQGSALAQVGKTIELAGLGKRFNGRAFISGIHHGITEGRWLTTAEFGLSAQWFAAEARQIAAPAASGQLPPIQGLQTGVVKKVAADPQGEFRVFVTLPLLQDDAKGVWARLATYYASNKVGAVFYPEVGDEVIVGFMNQDPRDPVILGSVYSKKLAPPITPDEKNNKKSLVTRSKLEINFDEENKIIEIKTPGKHSITLDDKGAEITIKDSNGNTASLSKSGITLDSATSVNISAKGDISIAAKGNLKLSATANASMEGLQVAHKAQTKFSAQASAQAEVTASGMLTLQAGLVKIN
jgi:Rhs element Vgr protein